MMRDWLKEIDDTWTLFLDRDGVINLEKETDYIRNWEEFRFLDGVIDAFPILSSRFGRILVVTNQKGVGKGLMQEQDLRRINENLVQAAVQSGGRIDRVYYCTATSDDDPCRKPNPGMALQARNEYPEIDFNRSLMVGNTMGDMKFGKACGMRTAFILSAKPIPELPDPLIDAVFPGLYSLAKAL